MDNSTAPDAKPTIVVPAKTPYSPPKLSLHGSVQQITKNLVNGATDGQGGSTLFPEE